MPLLKQMINAHPNKGKPNSYIWINTGPIMKHYGKPLRYSSVGVILKRMARLCGIKKPVSPHALRRARVTHLAGKLTEPFMRKMFGWVPESETPSKYIFLNDTHQDDVVLDKIYNKKKTAVVKNRMSPKVCLNCKSENPFDSLFCSRCH